MKRDKRILTSVLALTLCCLFSSEAFAIELEGGTSAVNPNDVCDSIEKSKENFESDGKTSITNTCTNQYLQSKENKEENINKLESTKLETSLDLEESSSVQADNNEINIEETEMINENEKEVLKDEINNQIDDEASDTNENDVLADTDNQTKTYEVNSNSNYSDTMTSAKETHLYIINTANMDKITSIVKFSESNTFSIMIYKLTDDSFEQVAASPCNILDDTMDSLALIPDGGVYVIAVTAENPGDFVFRVQESSSHSACEPNDSPFQANAAFDQFFVTDTFDNEFDNDWLRIDISDEREYRIVTSTNNCTLDELYIIDFNNGNITPITENSTDISLEKGTYYIYAAGKMSADDNSYSISMIPKESIATKVNISSIKSGSVESKATYTEGEKYKVSGSMTVYGTAYNEKNELAKNAIVFVCVKTYSGNLCYKAVSTDETGAFTATITLSAATGSRVYYNASQHMRYYYDIIPIAVMNYNYDNISSNVTSVYHFLNSKYVEPNSKTEKLTISSTPITYDYSKVYGYAKDEDGAPLANRNVVLAINFDGVPPKYSYINASQACYTAKTDQNGYFQINLVSRSSYNERYNPGYDCSYYAYLSEEKEYSYDELGEYARGERGSNWPFYWILDGGPIITSSVRTYIYV